ncbi:hypothetical protein MYAM1_002524 [Malassezia yamatoensis]|uniref:Uncharacterized protein n=1 Tax=Malassezia yamatoensis TaxID=253288 RepID=A0AAJ6CHD6_9BASI|nr:hypothetical protein MYAM1_002524 [Malassezia yamatoensis]
MTTSIGDADGVLDDKIGPLTPEGKVGRDALIDDSVQSRVRSIGLGDDPLSQPGEFRKPSMPLRNVSAQTRSASSSKLKPLSHDDPSFSAVPSRISPSKSLHSSKSMSSLNTPPRPKDARRRLPRVSYVTAPPQEQASTSSPVNKGRSVPAAQPMTQPMVLNTENTKEIDVEALLTMCASYGNSKEHKKLPSTFHEDMLHAIATKERLCLELREQLQQEERQLNSLRSAWQRLATRGGVKVSASLALSPEQKQVLKRRQSTILNPSAIQAQRVENKNPALLSRTPSLANLAARKSATPRPKDSSWRTRLPQQLSSWMEHVNPQDSSGSQPSQNSAQDVAQWLSSRDAEKSSIPPTPRAAADVLSQSRIKDPRSSSHGLEGGPPPPPPKDGENLGDRLVSGWNVLSKRLVETTSTLTDPNTWHEQLSGPPSSLASLPQDYLSDTSDSYISDHAKSPPQSNASNHPKESLGALGRRSITSRARQSFESSSNTTFALPPVPRKESPDSRASIHRRATNGSPFSPISTLPRSSIPHSEDDSGDAGDAINLMAFHDPKETPNNYPNDPLRLASE